jgi:hypothetical protein
MNRMSLRYRILGLTLALAGGLVAACGDDDGGSNNVNQNNLNNANNNENNGNTNNSNGNENQNNNNTSYGCDEICDDMIVAGCADGPSTLVECVEGCTMARATCPDEIEDLLDCAEGVGVATCVEAEGPTFAGCEAEMEAINTCVEEPPEFCETACPAVVAAGCENGPADYQDCLYGCEESLWECPVEWQAVADCAGAEPVFECNELDSPVVQGCDTANEALWACLTYVPQACQTLCPAVVDAACTNGPSTLGECLEGCGEMEQYCDTEFYAWVDCAGDEPSITCDMNGQVTVVGCEGETAAMFGCMGEEEP